MRQKKIVQIKSLSEPPVAIYPNQNAAAIITGVSRQALSQAIKLGTKVAGCYWMVYEEYQKAARGVSA